ncbi:MAG TPA: phosphoribosylformylglycinamidine synthase I [Candidatus Saccharimonadales bacterium]|nr:phosphoribosylformylglycinamidine synthase I [Candidatus Saccharimonadales bacterium]
MKPSVLILQSDGTNCDKELAFAFELAGAKAEFVHINDLRAKKNSFKNFQILALPGGFSYGDDVASGKILAVELTSFFAQELQAFTKREETLTIGICNGFQTLIRTGLLPFHTLGTMHATLTNNDSGHFECRWIRLKAQKSRCVFLKNEDQIGYYAINHGEGKFFADKKALEKIEKENLVTFRYVDRDGNQATTYPDNPNGALGAIAGLCDPTGRVFGMMPHPEKFVLPTQFPNWQRENIKKPHGLFLFENMVQFVKQS